MSPRLAVLLFAALVLLAGAVRAQKEKAQESSVDTELNNSVLNPDDEEEEELPNASAGADKAVADVLEDYTEDTFSVAPALSSDQDNVPRRPKKPSKNPPRAKPVGDWYGLRTPKDLLDGLDGDVQKDLTGAGGLCGQKKKVKVLQRDGTIKTVVQDACAVPPITPPKKPRSIVRPMRPKAIRPKKKFKPIVSEDEEDDELTGDVKINKKKVKKAKKVNLKPPTEEEEADSLIPRSQMMELTKAEEKRATDEYQQMNKKAKAKRRRPSRKIPFPGIPIGVDGEKIGRKGFGDIDSSSAFKTGPEDIMPLGNSASRKAKKAKSKPLTLIDPSDLAPLLDGSFLELETDAVRAFEDATQQVVSVEDLEDHDEEDEESL